MKWLRNVLLVGFIVVIAAAVFGGKSTHSNAPILSAEASAETSSISVPNDERKFVETISSFHSQFSSASTEFQQGIVYRNRAGSLRQSLVGGGKVSDWIGKVYKVSSNGDGFGVLEITLADDVWVTTWNNSFSDIGDQTLIKPVSPVYQKMAGLKEGDTVSFSGSFLPAQDTDVLKSIDISMGSKMTEPEFLFKFSNIALLN